MGDPDGLAGSWLHTDPDHWGTKLVDQRSLPVSAFQTHKQIFKDEKIKIDHKNQNTGIA